MQKKNSVPTYLSVVIGNIFNSDEDELQLPEGQESVCVSRKEKQENVCVKCRLRTCRGLAEFLLPLLHCIFS